MTKEKIKIGKEIDFKFAIYKENIKPVPIVSNLEFCKITGTSSIGHYQYDKVGQYFTYREQLDIHNLKKINLLDFVSLVEKRIKENMNIERFSVEEVENRYSIIFQRNDGGLYKFQRAHKEVFELIIDFYDYAKNKAMLRAS